MKRPRSQISQLDRIRTRVGAETYCSNDDARFLLDTLDAALAVNAALILERHKAAEKIAEEQKNAALRRV